MAAEHSSPVGKLPIVDTHQHLWDLKRLQLPWLPDSGPLSRSFLPADYRAATSGLNVVRSVYMEVDVTPEQHMAEAEYVIGLCRDRDNPMAGAVIGGRPADPKFSRYIANFRNVPEVKGVRQVLHSDAVPRGMCLKPEFIAGIRALGEAGLSFDICIRPEELTDAAKLIDACPDTRFVLDHCGNVRSEGKDITAWKRDIAAVAQRKNVIGKISGQIDKAANGWTAETLAPIINHTWNEFGPDRVVFGGDWPVCLLGGSYRSWVSALFEVMSERSEADQRSLLQQNAVKFYGLG